MNAPVPRFAVLQHDHPRGLHWDIMLETGDVLATWALAQPPDAKGPIPARRLPDHRKEYLDYEGPISGGRGSVTRWDGGTFQLEEETESRVVAEINGAKLQGRVEIERTGEDPEGWRFAYTPR